MSEQPEVEVEQAEPADTEHDLHERVKAALSSINVRRTTVPEMIEHLYRHGIGFVHLGEPEPLQVQQPVVNESTPEPPAAAAV